MSQEKKRKIDKEVYRRYLNDEGSHQDARSVAKWFATTKGAEILKEESWLFWNETSGEQEREDYNEEQMLDRLNHILRIEDDRISMEERSKRKRLTYVTRIAASLLIPLLFFSYLLGKGFFAGQEAMAFSSIHSPPGTRSSFHLPDGSKGWLNSGSTLQFPVKFSGKHREVQLEGEAYFDVVSNARKPFVVKADEIKVVALGTAFNVNAYKDDEISKVTLESGVVELFKSKDQRLRKQLNRLEPGAQFTYFKELGSHRTKEVDVKKITSWREGKLVFRQDPLAEVVDRLNRWYNVDIQIKDKKLESLTYRATFQDETLDEVLKLLKLSAPIEVEEIGREMLDDNTFGKRKIIFSLK